jgi:hypothetical protein
MLRARYSANTLRLSPQSEFDRGRFEVVVAQVKTSRDDESVRVSARYSDASRIPDQEGQWGGSVGSDIARGNSLALPSGIL